MLEEVLCPDCGGVVGETEATEAGPPCRCFTAPPPSPDESPVDSSDQTPAPAPKVCRLCGKDVTGKKRVRDPHGYYCYECHQEQEKKNYQGRVRCNVCGHLVKEENLIVYEGTRMCPHCHNEKIELQKKHIKQIGFRGAQTRTEAKQVLRLVMVLGVLALVILAGFLINHFRH